MLQKAVKDDYTISYTTVFDWYKLKDDRESAIDDA